MTEDDVGDLVRELYARKLKGVDLTDAILARTTQAKPSRSARRSKLFSGGLALAASLMMLAGAFAMRGHLSVAPVTARPVIPNAPVHGTSAGKVRAPENTTPETHTTAVDFGGTQGAIFLVSNGEHDTMVVWTFEEPKDEG